MNETYGIGLDLIISKFNNKIQQVKNSFKDIKSEKIELNTNNAQLNYLQYQIKEISALLDYNSKKPFMDEQELLKTEVELENLKNKYNQISLAQKNVKVSSNSMMSTMNAGISKISSKIKRFALSLLSIRGIFALISRASSAYLSQDTALAEKLQSVWVGLGAMLAPIIEWIAGILLKAVKYINVFIKALTGVDLLAKASAKSLNKTASSAKSLNKALAGFDELTNLDSNVGSGIDSGGFKGLENVKIDTTWADRIKQIGEWIKENKAEVISFLAGIASAIMLIRLGMDGIKALGIGVMIAGIVYTIQSLIKYLQDPSWANFTNIIKGIGIALLGLAVIIRSVPVAVAAAIILIVSIIMKYWNEIKGFLQKGIDWFTDLQNNVTQWFLDNIDKIKEKFGTVGALIVGIVTQTFNWIVEIVKGAINIVMNVFDGLFKGIKQIFDGIISIFKGNFKNGLISIGKGIVNALIGILNGLISGINAILYPLRVLIAELGKVGGKNWSVETVAIPRIPYLNVGTNYVPEDQLAYIHKGEAVIPKKFNSQQYFGDNEETNNLLQQVIDAVNNIQINPYTTIKDVGKASLQYINNRSRQLGESVVV